MEGDKEYGFQVWRRGRPFYFNFKSEAESDISEQEMMRIVGIFRVGFDLINQRYWFDYLLSGIWTQVGKST